MGSHSLIDITRLWRIITIALLVAVLAASSLAFQPAVARPLAAGELNNKVYLPLVMHEEVGKVYYVSPTGSDSSPGTFDRPWADLSKAESRLSPGDTLYLRGGVYHKQATFSKSGTQDQPIKVKGFPGETAVIDGQNTLPSETGGALIKVSASWIIVSDLEIRNSKNYAISFSGKHGTADNLYVHHIQRAGIISQGDYGIVQNCRVWRASLVNEFGSLTAGYSSGITTGRDSEDNLTQGAVIRNNVVWETWGQGITISHSDGTLVQGNVVSDSFSGNIYIHDTLNAVVDGNFVYMTGSAYQGWIGSNVGILLGSETYNPRAANITIINNIAFNNRRNIFWYEGGQATGMNNFLIANNTFVNGYPDKYNQTNVILNDGTNHQNVRFVNNIIVQPNDGSVFAALPKDPQVIVNHNLWSRQPYSYLLGGGDVIGDPKFAATGSMFTPQWYQLTPDSPAINKALQLAEVTLDFHLTMRSSTPELGAYEYP